MKESKEINKNKSEERRIYLDANIVQRYFKNFAISTRKGRKMLIPYVLRFLVLHQIRLVTSSFTFAEVFESMWKEFGLDPKEIVKAYQRFVSEFNVEVIFSFEIKPKIIRWVRRWRIEASDAIHLFVSKDRNLLLLTADNKFASRGAAIYPKIVTDEEILLEFSDLLLSSKSPLPFSSSPLLA